MGCDIHMYVETRKNDKWNKVGPTWKMEYWDGLSDEPYEGRNYRLFGLLANVRNGYGFAGCDTGNAITPIDMPRGLPADVSYQIQKISDNWGEDGHSHSWFTLKELLDVDWHGNVLTIRGYVSKQEAEEFRKNATLPSSWCGGTTNPNYEQIEWCSGFYDSMKDFVDTTIPRLQELGDPDRVRIVFFFDN